MNSICTSRGGTHVNNVADQLVQVLIKKATSANKKGLQLKPANVKQHLWVFVNCLVENPSFDSQTKDTLKTTPKNVLSIVFVRSEFVLKGNLGDSDQSSSSAGTTWGWSTTVYFHSSAASARCQRTSRSA